MPSERRLILYRSNRIESLLDCLAGELATLPSDPLIPEAIVVQSRGMATWLGLRLAERFGVWANPDFPHPRKAVERLLAAALGSPTIPMAFNRESLVLAILEILPRLPGGREFAPLNRYLADADDWKRLQLAERIAYLFDQYAVYRPEMVLAWEEQGDAAALAGSSLGDNAWQPLLWRQLAGLLGSPARPVLEALARLRAERPVAPELLPGRLFLFAITTLPPLYLALFNEAAKIIPVHLLLFTPAREYWADIFSPATLQKILLGHRGSEEAAGIPAGEALHLSDGHPLLASLGAVGREFQDLLEEQTEYQLQPGGERFDDGPDGGEGQPALLVRLQQDIMQLRPPEAIPLAPAAAADQSIVIHSCHSPLREVEVLQDRLLDLLAAGEFSPHEIVVMVPEIETYAPLIEAVFNRPAGDSRRIPYRIADRPLSRQAELIDALFQLFELVRGRLGVSRVLDFLAGEPGRRGAGLDEEQLRRIEQWLRQCRVRWGIDEEHRREHGQPADRLNTWRFGLDRLLLGYAMPGRESRIFAEVLPYDDIEGQDSGLAGLLLAFCDRLFKLAARVRTPRTLTQWTEVVRQVMGDFFGPESGAGAADDWQRQAVRDALAALAREGEAAGLVRPLELPAFLRLLKNRLDEIGAGHGFLDGGLTFCTMLPLRTIPFAMVCLLGMNDGAFPRQEATAGFDLLAAEPRPGDRSRRQDDRFLFLESLLSARRKLYISYVGRSIRDNTVLPPSVLVDELLDCLAMMIAPANAGGEPGEQRQWLTGCLVVEHPLQPFSPRYFNDPSGRLFTYAAEFLPVAAGNGERAVASSVAAASDSEVDKDTVAAREQNITLDQLHDFFRNPVAWYARRRLGIRLPDRDESEEDREPLYIEGLERYRLGRRLLAAPELVVARPDITCEVGPNLRLYQLLRASGVLPPGNAAWPALAGLITEVEPVAAFLATNPGGRPLPPMGFDLELPAGLSLAGELTQRVESGLLRFTPAKSSVAFFLACWLDHLVLCAGEALADQKRQTIMVGRIDRNMADIRIFRDLAPATALARLQDLAELFQVGERQPLPLFRRCSHEFAGKLMAAGEKGAMEEEALLKAREAAHNAFYGTGYNQGPPPDVTDPYVAAFFSGRATPGFNGGDELFFGFEELARRVYYPLLQCVEKY